MFSLDGARVCFAQSWSGGGSLRREGSAPTRAGSILLLHTTPVLANIRHFVQHQHRLPSDRNALP
jgi:hypothetical protein